MKFNLNNLTKFIEKNVYFSLLLVLIFITITITQFYNNQKKITIRNYKDTINNIIRDFQTTFFLGGGQYMRIYV